MAIHKYQYTTRFYQSDKAAWPLLARGLNCLLWIVDQEPGWFWRDFLKDLNNMAVCVNTDWSKPVFSRHCSCHEKLFSSTKDIMTNWRRLGLVIEIKMLARPPSWLIFGLNEYLSEVAIRMVSKVWWYKIYYPVSSLFLISSWHFCLQLVQLSPVWSLIGRLQHNKRTRYILSTELRYVQ